MILPPREQCHQHRRKVRSKLEENENSEYSGLPFGQSQNLPDFTDS